MKHETKLTDKTKKIGLAGDCLQALYHIRWVTLISRRRPRGGR